MDMNQQVGVPQGASSTHRWVLWAIIIVAAVAVAWGAYQYRGEEPIENDIEMMDADTGMMGGSENTIPMHAKVTVEVTDTGFSPSTVVIQKGDEVEFVNKRVVPVWPASGAHPTHLLCPGFDSLKGLATGETYSFTFTEVRECPMHDHLAPAFKGMISVKEASAMKGGQ